MTQRDLDDLFKRGAEQYDFSYRPDAWQQMDALLTKQRNDRRRKLLLLIGLLGLALVVAVYLWNTDTAQTEKLFEPALVEQNLPERTTENKNQQLYNAGQEVGQNGPSPKTNISEQEKSQQLEEGPSPNKQKEAALALQNTAPITDNPNRKEGIEIENNHPTSTGKISALEHNNPKNQMTEAGTEKLSSVASDQLENPLTISSDKRSKRAKIALAKIETLSFFPFREKALEKMPEWTDLKIYESEDDIAKSKINWAFGAVLSADWNAVGFMDRAQFGWQGGVNAKARLGGKWSIGLGLAYSKKDYIAEKGEYKGNPQLWPDHIYPETTDAKCNIVQIPLLLSYYQNGFSEKGFFTSAGLTTFLMSRERFKFNYDEVPPPTTPLEWEEKWTNKHLFGVGQIHAGYQGKINQKMAWQIGPYLQIPLGKGIGHGSVDLHSYGLQASLAFLSN